MSVVQVIAVAPTERSIPAVIKQKSIPTDKNALTAPCLKMFVILESVKKDRVPIVV